MVLKNSEEKPALYVQFATFSVVPFAANKKFSTLTIIFCISQETAILYNSQETAILYITQETAILCIA